MATSLDEPDMRKYEEHVRQNNLRLATLAKLIAEPVTFAVACNELHTWCKDPRAFVTNFEDKLMEALTSAFTVSTQEGYDLSLVSDLINTCFHHRRTLSKEGSAKIARWYEQLRRRRAARAAKVKRMKDKAEREERRKEEEERNLLCEKSADSYPLHEETGVVVGSSTDEGGTVLINRIEHLQVDEDHLQRDWPLTGQEGSISSTMATGGGGGPSTSVVAPLQSPAFGPTGAQPTYAMMSPSYPMMQQRQMMMMPGGMPPGAAAPAAGMPGQPGMPMPHPAMYPHPMMMQPPGCTATMVKKEPGAAGAPLAPSQQPMHPGIYPYGSPGVALMIMMNGAHVVVHKDPATNMPVFVVGPQGAIMNGHPSYPSMHDHFSKLQHHMMMRQQQHMAAIARAQAQQRAATGAPSSASPAPAMAAPSPHFGQQPAFNAQGVPLATQTAPGQVRPLYTPGGSIQQPASATGPGAMIAPSPGFAPGPGMPQASMVQRVGTPMMFGSMIQQQQQAAAQHQVVCVPNPMALQINENMSAAMPDTVLLEPFGLTHGEMGRKVNFTISSELYDRFLRESNLEVHIRSFYEDDRVRRIYWPSDNNKPKCEVRLNGTTITGQSVVRPFIVYFSSGLIRLGENSLELIEHDCVCKSNFSLSVMQRVTLKQLVDMVWSQPHNADSSNIERSKARMRELISRESPNGQIILQLFDIRTRKLMRTPARSLKCSHPMCFDLEMLLASTPESDCYECHICKTVFTIQEIEIDPFVASIIKDTYQRSPQPLEAMVDSSCSWQAIQRDQTDARFFQQDQMQRQHMMQQQQMQQQQSAQQQQSYPSPYMPSTTPTSGNGVQPQQQGMSMTPQQHQLLQQQHEAAMAVQQQQQMANSRKRAVESETMNNGGTALKRFKSETFPVGHGGMGAGHSPATMQPASVAPSMMMGPTTPMSSSFSTAGPPSVPAMNMHPMMSPFGAVAANQSSPMKSVPSNSYKPSASPAMTMAPGTPFSAGCGPMVGQPNPGHPSTSTTMSDGNTITTVPGSAPYTPSSVESKMPSSASSGQHMAATTLVHGQPCTANGMSATGQMTQGATGPGHHGSSMLTPDTLPSTSNCSAEDESHNPVFRDSLSNIDLFVVNKPELNLSSYLYDVGDIDDMKFDDFKCYNFDTPPQSLTTAETWADALSVIGSSRQTC